MDFALTEEQQALRATARAWLARHRTEPESGPDDRLWRWLVRLGWLDPDLGLLDLAVLAEETGAALLPGPWFATVGLAAPAYRAAGRPLDRPATMAWAGPAPTPPAGAAGAVHCRAADSDGAARLSGVLRNVAEPVADVVVLAHGTGGVALYRVDLTARPEVVRQLASTDPTRRLADLHLTGTGAEPLVSAARTPDVLHEVRQRAGCLLAAEAVGVAQRALTLAVEHARTRVQFGRPIGAYQAVAHPLADVAVAVELARSLVYRAAWCAQVAADDAARAVAMATVAAREAALHSCATAIQTLGGTGFTWEHPVHWLYRRARWIAGFDGTPAAHRARLASLLLDGSPVESVAVRP
jgi:acyl-CoA dehydrogenase